MAIWPGLAAVQTIIQPHFLQLVPQAAAGGFEVKFLLALLLGVGQFSPSRLQS
jgi:hypothetical protein